MAQRIQRITAQLESIQDYPHCEVCPVSAQDTTFQVVDKWIVWIRGRKDSLFYPGVYPLTIKFPPDFPKRPPTVQFQQQFQHIHVYKGGLICMPVISADYWKPNRTMLQIISRLEDFMHQVPNLASPANQQLAELYKEDRHKYEQLMQKQAERYMQKNLKYFKESCIHINFQ